MTDEERRTMLRDFGFTDEQIDRAMAQTNAMTPEEQHLMIARELSEVLPGVPCSVDEDGRYHLDEDALRRLIDQLL